jgi:putative ABC transport system substrate-binding protein
LERREHLQQKANYSITSSAVESSVGGTVRPNILAVSAFASGPLRAKAATTTIPIVFIAAEDPVRLGLVASLARPGGNATGINFLNNELAAKRLELLHQLVPAATRVAALVNPAFAGNYEAVLQDLDAAARALGLQIQVLKASTSAEINASFATLVRERLDALFVAGDPFFTNRRTQIVNLASHHSVPATYSGRQFVEAGGLMSYGSNLLGVWHQFGVYTGRILKGAKCGNHRDLTAN